MKINENLKNPQKPLLQFTEQFNRWLNRQKIANSTFKTPSKLD